MEGHSSLVSGALAVVDAEEVVTSGVGVSVDTEADGVGMPGGVVLAWGVVHAARVPTRASMLTCQRVRGVTT